MSFTEALVYDAGVWWFAGSLAVALVWLAVCLGRAVWLGRRSARRSQAWRLQR